MLKKISDSINVDQLRNDFKETLRRLVCKNKGYSFLKEVRGSASYWKSLLYDVLAMIKTKSPS